MDVDVRGKRVVVAGGSRGIGRSIALAFAETGTPLARWVTAQIIGVNGGQGFAR